MIAIYHYRRTDGVYPFERWLADLRDARAVARVAQRVRRLEAGLWGDCKPVGEGVLELRIDYGPGYRVYLGRHGATIVVLLSGGDKHGQSADIERAKEYWNDCKKRGIV